MAIATASPSVRPGVRRRSGYAVERAPTVEFVSRWGVLDVVPITATISMLRFDVVNAYAVRLDSGFAVVDTGPLGSEVAILAALTQLGEPADLRQIVLTHSHKDHAGSARALAEQTGAIVLAGASDASVIAGISDEPEAVITSEERPFYDRIAPTIPPAAPVHVDRLLHEGDDLGWDRPSEVIEVPGHTTGSIAVHLPDERVLLTGDNVASLGGMPILGPFDVARQEAIESFRRLAAIDVEIACFGHGDPILADAHKALLNAAGRL
jgi:glyoxylase-like metal-dependent hydrolase (beta-lactamase superfamily II)